MSAPSEEESQKELRDAGMTEASIEGLTSLTRRFQSGFPSAQESDEGPEKFMEEYAADVEKFRSSMSSEDQSIYNDYLKKYGLE